MNHTSQKRMEAVRSISMLSFHSVQKRRHQTNCVQHVSNCHKLQSSDRTCSRSPSSLHPLCLCWTYGAQMIQCLPSCAFIASEMYFRICILHPLCGGLHSGGLSLFLYWSQRRRSFRICVATVRSKVRSKYPSQKGNQISGTEREPAHFGRKHWNTYASFAGLQTQTQQWRG
jgi:hypothetical protein